MRSYLDEIQDRHKRRSANEAKRDKPLGLDDDSVSEKDYQRTYSEGSRIAEFAVANIDRYAEDGDQLSPSELSVAKAAAVGAAFVEAEKSWLKRGEDRKKVEASRPDPSLYR